MSPCTKWSLTIDKVGLAVAVMPASIVADFLEATAKGIRKLGPTVAIDRLRQGIVALSQKFPGMINVVDIDEAGLTIVEPT